MKAWMIQDSCEEQASVEFAETRGKARSMGAGEMDCEFLSVKATRAPEYDKYTPGPVPVEVLIADGWWWGCSSCGDRVDNDTEAPLFVLREVWCSAECRQAEVDRKASVKRINEEAVRGFRDRFPECTEVKAASFSCTPPTAVEFRFPGGQYRANWFSDDHDHVNVARCDHEAWRAYRKDVQAGTTT